MAEPHTDETLQCYLIPGSPLPLVLPVECVAEIAPEPDIEKFADAPAMWMSGHTTWQNQRLPVMSFSSLQDINHKQSDEAGTPYLVVLNPVPEAARKAFSGLLCYGDVEQINVGRDVVTTSIPESVDRRYVDAVIDVDGQQCMVPKLSAISVAFSYF